jgi:hypothetical protein
VLNSALAPFAKLSPSALLAAGLTAAWLYRRRDRRPDLEQGWSARALLMAAVPFLAWVTS